MNIKNEVDSNVCPPFNGERSGEISGELEVSISKNGDINKIKTSRVWFVASGDSFQFHFYFADFPTRGIVFFGNKDQWVGSHEIKKDDLSLIAGHANFTSFGGSWSLDDPGKGEFIVDKFDSGEAVQEMAGKFNFNYKSVAGDLVEVISPNFWVKREVNEL